MKKVIFLNTNQKQLLVDTGIGVQQLSDKEIYNTLSLSDIQSIQTKTTSLLEQGKLLSRYGFEPEEDRCFPVFSSNDMESNYSISNTPLDAECIDANTIVVWIADSAYSTNNMLQYNLRKIVKAISKVMPFDDLINTSQFKLMVLSS